MKNKKNAVIGEKLTTDQKEISYRIFDLILGRILKIVYLRLNEKERENMGTTFSLGDEKLKEKFIKENIPDFEKLFIQETKNIDDEIRILIKK
jgi:hypothetical protein